MKHLNNKNATNRLVFAGVLIFVLCLSALLVHIIDVHEIFFEHSKDAIINHMETGMSLMNEEISDLNDMSLLCETALAEREEGQSIGHVLAELQAVYTDYEFFYLSESGVFHSPTITIENLTPSELLGEIYSFEYKDHFICLNGTGLDENGKEISKWLGVRETAFDDEMGYLLINHSMEDIFEEEYFGYLTEIGCCCIINEDGTLLEYSSGFEDMLGLDNNLFSVLTEYGGNKRDVRTTIREMRNDLSQEESDSLSFGISGGKDCFVVYSKIKGTRDCFFVAVFDDVVLEPMIQDVLIRTFVVGVVIFVLMVVVLFITWNRDIAASGLIESLAYSDPVTGGKNMNYFKRNSWEIIKENRETPFLVYRFDIVRFRYINESYGHVKADSVLRACIQEFDRIYGKNELCVRVNSDQFLALVVNDMEVNERYQTYLKAVGEKARECGVKYPIRFRLGIYQVHKDDEDIDIIIDHANVARKSMTGKEKVLEAFYSDVIVSGMKKINDIESIMQPALAQGEFQIYLQPKWNIAENRVAGAEALARWVRKDGTVIYPSDFIPVFENNGFIEKLDVYMLERLCMNMQEIMEDGKYRQIPISVNQSRLLIMNPDYVKHVEKMVNRYQIPLENLEIEITETVFFDEKEKMIEVVNQLKNIGIVLAMDDFGSGFSSLNILKDVPFDVLKIDREFFSETNTSETSILILEKIVEMAKGLGIEVVCEGVETKEQVEVLRNIGCERVQGYFYGRPIPFDEFMEKYCII